MAREVEPDPVEELTPREADVLALLREGLTNGQIARRLDVSPDAAKYHVSQIIAKLGVRNRYQAAVWPERPPWWAAALAPLGLGWRKISSGPLAAALALGAAVLVAAGIGLLVWGLLRTSGGSERADVAAAGASVGDLLACYREDTTPAESPSASQSLLGAHVSVGGQDVGEKTTEEILLVLRDVEPVYFGVRGNPGTRIGEPGRLAETTLQIDLSDGGLTLKYVRPGPVAPYGLLFDPALINNWDLITMLSPAGYAQQACTVPRAFDQVMAGLGFEGYDPTDILEARVIPVPDAQRECCLIERIDVWREGKPRRSLSSVPEDALWRPIRRGRTPGLATGEMPQTPVEPFSGEPLMLEVRFKGIDPFPEAVRPTVYQYYRSDSSASGRGVLVPLTGIAVYNGGGAGGGAFYPEPDLDGLLRDAASSD